MKASSTDVEGGDLVSVWEEPRDGEPGPRIDRADPRIWMSDEFVEQARRSPWVEFTTGDPGSRGVATFYGEPGVMVTFRGTNRSVTYRVVERDAAQHRWLLEWPD